jgi:rRNA-processing protein FCF1
MDGKGYINNPYLSVSSVLSKSYKILIRDAVRKEYESLSESLSEKLREEIYTKIREDLVREITEEVYKKLKSETDSLKRDEWERIGSPDIK